MAAYVITDVEITESELFTGFRVELELNDMLDKSSNTDIIIIEEV